MPAKFKCCHRPYYLNQDNADFVEIWKRFDDFVVFLRLSAELMMMMMMTMMMLMMNCTPHFSRLLWYGYYQRPSLSVCLTVCPSTTVV